MQLLQIVLLRRPCFVPTAGRKAESPKLEEERKQGPGEAGAIELQARDAMQTVYPQGSLRPQSFPGRKAGTVEYPRRKPAGKIQPDGAATGMGKPRVGKVVSGRERLLLFCMFDAC